jgi:hypothetical protein
MKIQDPEILDLPPFQELNAVSPPTTGTVDDDDEPEDETDAENEAPIREINEATEAPEEFEIDDEDDLGHPEDDAADDDEEVEKADDN